MLKQQYFYMGADAAIVYAVRREVRTVVREELARFLLELKPHVTEKEMKELEEQIGSPEDYDNDFEEVQL
jgi:hypothetical protein